jgi:IrrE N-terminal-like domain
VPSGTLGEEWASIGSLEADEREFCLAAARLAIDPYAAEDAVSSSIPAAEESLQAALLEEFLDAVDPSGIRSGLGWVERGSDKIRTSQLSDGSGRDLEALAAVDPDERSRPGEPPWAGGYRKARSVRRRRGESARIPFEVDGIIPTSLLSASDHSLVAIGGRSEAGAQGLILGHKLSKSYLRFAQARALRHLISDEEGERFLITNSNSGRQKAARAFAAELLAPAQGIAEMLEGAPYVDQGTTDRVAAHFGVSALVVQHQIDNQLATGSYLPGD